MDDGVIIFIPYGSRLGFHVGGPASTMANIDYKFPQCVCYEVPMDERLIVLNGQCGAVMDVSNEVTATLRAQDHGHAPVVCLNFQGSKSNNVCTEDGTCYSMNAMHGHDVHVVCFGPGIMSRDCSAGNRAYENLCSTLRANMGDNQPAVCYAIEGNVVDRISAKNGKGWCEDVSPTLNTQDKHAVCFQVESIGHDIRSTQFSRGGCCDTMTASDYKDPIIVCYAIENHPADSRIRIEKTDTFQTLSARCGTGGGNVPLVLMRSNHEQDELPDTLGCTEQTNIHH